MLVTVQEDKGDPFVNHGSKAVSSPAASSSVATSTFKSKAKRFCKLDRIEEPLGQDDADED